MKIGKIFASAGCGKTTALLQKLDKSFEGGLKPQQVLFTTFTRSGAYEARDRAVKRFNFDEEAFIYFRTLHSICYRAIIAPKIMTHRDYTLLGMQLHCRFGSAGIRAEIYERGKGDAMLALYNLQRNILCQTNLIPGEYGLGFSPQEYDHFVRSYEDYRNSRGLFDYTDLLEEVLREDMDPLPVEQAFIDEAQDLTPLQYKVAMKLAGNAEWLWFAGDDDQSIFTYSGADPEILIDMEAEDKVVLEHSYRLPASIADYANTVAERITKREEKHVQAFEPLRKGTLSKSDNFLTEIDPDEPTVILCRNRVFFGYFEEELRKHGLLYSFVHSGLESDKKHDLAKIRRAILLWEQMLAEPSTSFPVPDILEILNYMPLILLNYAGRKKLREHMDRELSYHDLTRNFNLLAQMPWQKSLRGIPYEDSLYMETLIKKGKLAKEPNIRIGTVHSFKGKEEDHVIVLPDMSWQTWKTYGSTPDSEHRVFFVAVSRAKNRLTLLHPLTRYYYNW